jgi:hypothetical protein
LCSVITLASAVAAWPARQAAPLSWPAEAAGPQGAHNLANPDLRPVRLAGAGGLDRQAGLPSLPCIRCLDELIRSLH